MNKIIQGDCLDKLKELEDNSIDSIVTDPPYELGFMGKSWDSTGIANNKDMWAECLRVLKPGGHLLAFSGTRTYHRMASAIEDAGFEVRDMIEWVYGSGFPKSLNIGKAVDKLQGNERKIVGEKRTPDGKTWSERRPNGDITGYVGNGENKKENTQGIETKGTSEWEGWGTALKPAHEPICMARKPLSEKTVAENCLKWGTDGKTWSERRPNGDITGYVGNGENKKENTRGIETKGTSEWEGWGTALKPDRITISYSRSSSLGTARSVATTLRRFPDIVNSLFYDFPITKQAFWIQSINLNPTIIGKNHTISQHSAVVS